MTRTERCAECGVILTYTSVTGREKVSGLLHRRGCTARTRDYFATRWDLERDAEGQPVRLWRRREVESVNL